jgi:hypothetical protein
VSEGFQSRLGHHVFAGAENPSADAAEQKGERTLFRVSVRKCDGDHTAVYLPHTGHQRVFTTFPPGRRRQTNAMYWLSVSAATT